MSQKTVELVYDTTEAPGEDSYSEFPAPRDVPVHRCRSQVGLMVEGEAAQERRVAACIARGITWLSVCCQEAMDQEELYWPSGWLHDQFDLLRDRNARGEALWARGSLSVEGEPLYGERRRNTARKRQEQKGGEGVIYYLNVGEMERSKDVVFLAVAPTLFPWEAPPLPPSLVAPVLAWQGFVNSVGARTVCECCSGFPLLTFSTLPCACGIPERHAKVRG